MSVKRALFVTSLVLFLAFSIFSYVAARNHLDQINFDTTVKLQDKLSRNWDLPFSYFSVIGSAEVTSLIWITLALITLFNRYWKVFLLLPLFFVSVIIEIIGKIFINHPGPPYLFYRGVLDFNFPSHYVHTSYSYPSGHMTRTAFLATFLIVYLQFKAPYYLKVPLQLGLVAFLGFMIVSRIYLGEHWLSDVIGGLLLGTSFGIIPGLFIPAKRYQKDLKTNIYSSTINQ